MNDYDNPFDYALGPVVTHYRLGEPVEPAKQEPNDFDDNKKSGAVHPVQIVTDLNTGKTEVTESGIEIGKRGFLAVLKEGTITAPTRRELRKRIASLLANEAYAEDSTPIEIYRVTRLPLAKQVSFKF